MLERLVSLRNPLGGMSLGPFGKPFGRDICQPLQETPWEGYLSAPLGNPSGGGGCTQFVHGRCRMTIDPRIPTMPGRSTSGFCRTDREGQEVFLLDAFYTQKKEAGGGRQAAEKSSKNHHKKKQVLRWRVILRSQCKYWAGRGFLPRSVVLIFSCAYFPVLAGRLGLNGVTDDCVHPSSLVIHTECRNPILS